MRRIVIFLPLLLLLANAACSVTPDRPVTRKELYRTNLFTEFTIKDAPESVIEALNRDGEVVLEGKSRYGEDYFIKILATSKGLLIRVYAK